MIEPRAGVYFSRRGRPGKLYKVTSYCLGEVYVRELVATEGDQDKTSRPPEIFTVEQFQELAEAVVPRPGSVTRVIPPAGGGDQPEGAIPSPEASVVEWFCGVEQPGSSSAS